MSIQTQSPQRKGVSEEAADSFTQKFSGCRIATTYDKEKQALTIGLPAGREQRSATFYSEKELDALSHLPLKSLHLIGDYAAFCSYEEGTIEALIDPIFPKSFLFTRMGQLFDPTATPDQAKQPITASSPTGVSISLQLGSPRFQALAPFTIGWPHRLSTPRTRPLATIRISNARFSTNDDAESILRSLADSIFFQIDLLSGIALGLARYRGQRIESAIRSAKSEFNESLRFPMHEFHKEAMSHYWFAREARGAPQFRFLSYYQVLEFYYPTYTHNEACRRVEQILKDPGFRAENKSDINRILTATEVRQTAGERDQLKVTLTSCVDVNDFRQWLEEDSQRLETLTTKAGNAVSKHTLPPKTSPANPLEAASLRIYDIRCRIVHHGPEPISQSPSIRPHSPEAKQLTHDIEMVEFFSRKVLIANAAPIQVHATAPQAGDAIVAAVRGAI